MPLRDKDLLFEEDTECLSVREGECVSVRLYDETDGEGEAVPEPVQDEEAEPDPLLTDLEPLSVRVQVADKLMLLVGESDNEAWLHVPLVQDKVGVHEGVDERGERDLVQVNGNVPVNDGLILGLHDTDSL